MSDALDPFSYYVPASERAPTRRSRPPAPSAPASSSRAAAASPTSSRPCPALRPRRPACKPGDLIDIVDGKPAQFARSGRSRPRSRDRRAPCRDRPLPRRRREENHSLVPRARFEPPAPVDALGAGRRDRERPGVHARRRRTPLRKARRRGQPALDPGSCARPAGLDRRRDRRRRSRGFALPRERAPSRPSSPARSACSRSRRRRARSGRDAPWS